MSERYTKLFALPENLYSVGAPVVIAAGALQKDNQTGRVFAQLKIRNIQDKSIKAATVKITPFDPAGKPLGEAVDYQYLDLTAERDADFGQKTPVILPEAATRSFSVSVSEVIFSDNSIWTASNEAWEPLSIPVTPEKEFTDGELAKQYRVKYGVDCKCVFKKEKDLWRCACGAVNHDSEKICHSCQRARTTLAALNVDELKADRDQRLAAEQKKAAEEKAAAAEQAKKTKKIAMIVAPLIVIALVAAMLIFQNIKAKQDEAAFWAAVERFDYDQEYFKKRMRSYESVSGSEIEDILIQNPWYVHQESRLPYIATFYPNGVLIEDFGDQAYETIWKLDGNIITMSTYRIPHTCKMLKISDEAYLLVKYGDYNDGEPYYILTAEQVPSDIGTDQTPAERGASSA